MKDNLKFIRAEEKDTPVISALAKKIWNKHYPGIISQDQIDYMLERTYTEASLKKQMDEGQKIFLAYEGETPLGFIGIEEKTPGHFFLSKIYIDTTKHRSGIGTEFFDFIINELKPETITLACNRKNYKSINFYFKVGFKIEKVVDLDIGNGYVMEDFVMKWLRDN